VSEQQARKVQKLSKRLRVGGIVIAAAVVLSVVVAYAQAHLVEARVAALMSHPKLLTGSRLLRGDPSRFVLWDTPTAEFQLSRQASSEMLESTSFSRLR
jgi:hypothetical protein